ANKKMRTGQVRQHLPGPDHSNPCSKGTQMADPIIPQPLVTMTQADAKTLATRLGRCGTETKLAEQVAVLETEARMAGRLITAMLRKTNHGDIWRLPPEA